MAKNKKTLFLDFSGNNDYIELNDGHWHTLVESSDGHSSVIWIDGKKLPDKRKKK